jgi:tetratricopeptide (TPR) repeat protein
MTMKRRVTARKYGVIAALLATACLSMAVPAWAQRYPMASGNTIYIPPETLKLNIAGPVPDEDDKSLAKVLDEGLKLVQTKRQSEAIFMYFDRVASVYASRFTDRAIDYYCARTQPEQLLYLVTAANAKRTAQVVPLNWSVAYYFKAYALAELGRLGEARQQISRALALSPQNARFLGELGHIEDLEKQWQPALETFKRAEAAARAYSPDSVRNQELSRAWRGMAFSLIELKQYDEAEVLYRKCLELDPNDTNAQHELRYLKSLRSKGR